MAEWVRRQDEKKTVSSDVMADQTDQDAEKLKLLKISSLKA